MKTENFSLPFRVVGQSCLDHNKEPIGFIQTDGVAFDVACARCVSVEEHAKLLAFITLACNSHYELLEALQSCVEWMEFTIPRLAPNTDRLNWGGPIGKARDAIAKAKAGGAK